MQKIIIVGDTRGNFDTIFNRINTIHTKHGPFTAAFCIGNFFGDDSSQLQPYIQQQKSIAIPTYFIVSNDKDTSIIDKLANANNGGKICKNLTFLGRFGIKTLHGIRIAYLSGLYDSNLFTKSASEIRTYLAIKEINSFEKKENETENNLKLQNTHAATEFRRYYCSNDISQTIISNNENTNIDILLTSEWSRLFYLGILHGIDTTSHIPNNLSLSEFSKFGKSPIVNKLALSLIPQYHFVSNENIFFKLTPYKTNETSLYLTRFISLGQNKNVYAININPLINNKNINMISENIIYTKCPYTLPFKQIEENKNNNYNIKDNSELKRVVHKRKFNEMDENNNNNNNNNMCYRWNMCQPPSTYICHKCGIPGHYINDCGKNISTKINGKYGGNRDDYFFEKFGGKRAMKRAKKSGGECWFCLGSKKLESHMVVSVGEYTYLALAKGPMIRDHLLIIPINHLSNSMKFTVGIRKEIDKYLICLEKCYENENKILLICDRNLQTQYSQHCYLEIIAIENDKINGLKETLFNEGKKQNIEFIINKDKNNKYNIGSFGYLILHNNKNGEKYVHSVQSGMKQRIPLNFLRKVIAIHLGIPEKGEWTACIQQQGEETTQTNRLKDKFKPYDWTQSELAK